MGKQEPSEIASVCLLLLAKAVFLSSTVFETFSLGIIAGSTFRTAHKDFQAQCTISDQNEKHVWTDSLDSYR